MSVAYPSLETHLKAIGNAFVLVGDPFTASGLSVLGLKEGDIEVDPGEEYSDLTFPEQTGNTVHASKLRGMLPVVTIPLIISAPSVWATVSPTASSNAGHSSQQAVTETTLVIVPESDFGAGPWEYATAAWSPADPVGAVWFWKGHFQRPTITYREEDAGKVVTPVSFRVMSAVLDATLKANLAEGHYLWTIGDPAAQGITNLAI